MGTGELNPKPLVLSRVVQEKEELNNSGKKKLNYQSSLGLTIYKNNF
jgi:hypothetical protein